jgi:hypothetical protein
VWKSNFPNNLNFISFIEQFMNAQPLRAHFAQNSCQEPKCLPVSVSVDILTV